MNLPMEVKSIKNIVNQMCLYWSISDEHKKKTLLQFSKIVSDLNIKLEIITPEQLMEFFLAAKAASSGTDESVRRKFDYIKRVFKYASASGYIASNPCALIKLPKSKRASIIHLNALELLNLQELETGSAVLSKAKDLFLFQCETGLAFSDLKTFGIKKIHLIEGKYYLCGDRTKTGTEYIIPFSVAARTIAEKFNYDFRIGSINYYNILLKRLQQQSGIQTRLTTHVARRTFGQLMIDRGIRLDVVSKMLGHSSTGMTERYYARVGLHRVIQDVQHLAAA